MKVQLRVSHHVFFYIFTDTLLRPPSELGACFITGTYYAKSNLRGVWKDTILPKYWVTPSNERFDYFSDFHEHKS